MIDKKHYLQQMVNIFNELLIEDIHKKINTPEQREKASFDLSIGEVEGDKISVQLYYIQGYRGTSGYIELPLVIHHFKFSGNENELIVGKERVAQDFYSQVIYNLTIYSLFAIKSVGNLEDIYGHYILVYPIAELIKQGVSQEDIAKYFRHDNKQRI